MVNFTDDKSRQLLRLLHEYQEEFSPDLPQTIPALAEDLSMSMDTTTNDDERMSLEIQHAWDNPKWPGEK